MGRSDRKKLDTPDQKEKKKKPEVNPDPQIRQVAAIDIGTSAIRLALAEITPEGHIRRLETLTQSVSIGRDTFTEGRIRPETIEECVRILASFKQVMQEYLVVQVDQIRAVATSAVREAQNREIFIDRIYMATGIIVEAIDEAETTRLTYLGVQPYLSADPALLRANHLVVEVGGGSTEFLQVSDGDIAFSHVYPLGSLRAIEASLQEPVENPLSAHQQRTQVLIDEVREQIKSKKTVRLFFLGGDARFAARQIKPGWDASKPAKISTAALSALTDELTELSVDDLVETYHLTYPEAETLLPSLQVYTALARKFEQKQVQISGITMRDGLLVEMMQRDAWSNDFNRQIIRSAKELGLKYKVNEPHADEVAFLATQLFDELADLHRLPTRYRLVLQVAAYLHEVGLFISDRAYQKHSMYIIQNSEIFGLGKRMAKLVALVARYHHKAAPSMRHTDYASVDREDRLAVNQLAALLRVADALGQSRRQRIEKFSCQRKDAQLTIFISGIQDLTLEQIALQAKGSLFQDVFGMEVKFRKKAASSR